MRADIEMWLAPCEVMDDFKPATMLDPRFKPDWCQNDESRDVFPADLWTWIGIVLLEIRINNFYLELTKWNWSHVYL